MEVDLQSLAYPKNFFLLGTSFRKLAVDERELFALIDQEESQLIRNLKDSSAADEIAMISTCNRFEVLTVYPADDSFNPEVSKRKILGFLQTKLGKNLNEDDFYFYNNRQAIEHLFNVASSLDSMVLGEGQILGQVKQSYQRAVEHGCTGKFLHHLFQFAFHVAKKVRSSTSLGEKGVSISYVAVKLAEQIFGDLKGRSVLVIGSGQMAELAALHFKTHGAEEIIVANRTLDRAFELAAKINASAISLTDISHHLPRVDIVISSITQTDHELIEVETVKNLKRDKSLFLLDLGVPRNFSSGLGELDDVYLYNIDDLAGIAEQNKKIREEAAKEARVLIDYGMVQFEKWLHKVSIEPKILDMRTQVQKVCRQELQSLFNQHIAPDQREQVLDSLSYRISQKISHDLSSMIVNASEERFSDEKDLSFIIKEYLK